MTAPYTLASHLAALIADGFEVTIASGDPTFAYYVHLDKLDDADAGTTAGGASIAEALWTASPLHADNEPLPKELTVPGADLAGLLVKARAMGYLEGRQVPVKWEQAVAVLREARDGLDALLSAPE